MSGHSLVEVTPHRKPAGSQSAGRTRSGRAGRAEAIILAVWRGDPASTHTTSRQTDNKSAPSFFMTCGFSVQCTGLKAGSGSRSLLIYINLLRVSNVRLQVRVFRETGSPHCSVQPSLASSAGSVALWWAEPV